MFEISIVIPCFNDEQKLEQLLTQLQQLPYPPREVIVVDGASSQNCKKICTQYNATWLASETCRGKQLLVGAEITKGYVLWFLHADSQLSKDPIRAIKLAIRKGAIGGYFKFKFNTPRAWPALLLELAIAIRCRFGIPYGDQGLFMIRQAYVEAGGHAPLPLFEEVSLVQKIRNLGYFKAINEPIFVNPRRWQRDGWWRRTWENRKLALAYSRGGSPHELAEQYRSQITN